tara:strand:+ start:353 stop:1318 length:966 start_codon:yes stop_codon:yes gene_type:complete
MVKKHTLLVFLVSCLFSQNYIKERVIFNSANPFSFFDIITNLKYQKPQKVFGILKIPENGKKEKLPLVIGVPGSYSWAPHHYEYMEMFRKNGFATFELKSFESRNVSSTVGNQVQVTTAMIILDAYKALESLSKDKRVDINRIGIIGWSLGGAVSLYSAWKPLKDAISPKLRFKAHLSFYPPCMIDIGLFEFTDAPIQILAGELDDWVPAEPCKNLVKKMQSFDINADIIVYDNAHHSFDRSTVPRIDKDGYKFGDCFFKMRDDGAVLMNFLDIPMDTPLRQKIALAFCADRGPTYGGNPIARKSSFKFALDFMEINLSLD